MQKTKTQRKVELKSKSSMGGHSKIKGEKNLKKKKKEKIGKIKKNKILHKILDRKNQTKTVSSPFRKKKNS